MTTTTHTRSTVLDELLEADLDYRTGTRGGFYNHLAMALVAVHRLGGSAEQLRDLAAGSSSYALPRSRPAELESLRADIDRLGPGPVVRDHVSRALDVPGAAFFHSLIRLAYALDVEHSGQIAGAIVDWAAHDDVLPGAPAGGGTVRVPELFAELRALADPGDQLRNGLDGVAARPGFETAVARAAADDETLDELAAASLAAYVTGNDFGTLHMVTGVQAARVIDGMLDKPDRQRFRSRLVQAVAAAYVVSGAPELGSLQDVELPTWQQISRLAAASHDLHVSKLAYSASLEFARTGDPTYQYVAARVVGLVS